MTKLRDKPALKPSIEKAARKLLEEKLGRYGLERVDIIAADDHAGEPALYFEANYRLSPEPIDPAVTSDAQLQLVRYLFDLGEERFPYLRNHFDEAQKVLGYD